MYDILFYDISPIFTSTYTFLSINQRKLVCWFSCLKESVITAKENKNFALMDLVQKIYIKSNSTYLEYGVGLWTGDFWNIHNTMQYVLITAALTLFCTSACLITASGYLVLVKTSSHVVFVRVEYKLQIS